MKQFVITVMAAAMPYMSWLVWLGAALMVVGAVATLSTIVSGSHWLLARRSTNLLLATGVVFVACQATGWLLGMSPQINFERWTGRAFDLKPFWEIGCVFALAAVALRAVAPSHGRAG